MTNYNTAEEKTAESSETPAAFNPSSWRCKTYRRNGCGKRIAVFEHREKNETITVELEATVEIFRQLDHDSETADLKTNQ